MLRVYYKSKRFRRRIRGIIIVCVSNSYKASNINIEKINSITPEYIWFGNNIFIGKNSRIQGLNGWQGKTYSPRILIRNNVTIEQNLHLTCANEIYIGDGTAIAANVTISDIIHEYNDINVNVDEQPIETIPVRIGDSCKIYNNVVILPGTILGKHCIVGANSVVKGEFPDNCVIVGSPAKIIKVFSHDDNKWIRY